MKTGKSKEIHSGIIPLWHAGYYDGPLSGMCEYKGQKCFFSMKHEYISKKLCSKVCRTFWIYQVTDEQWKEIDYWHSEFRIHVGSHCDYRLKDDKGKFIRVLGTNDASFEYMKEMYYDRHDAHNLKNGNIFHTIEKSENIIGWTTWDVLMGGKWKEWRRSKKKVVGKNVRGEKEGS